MRLTVEFFSLQKKKTVEFFGIYENLSAVLIAYSIIRLSLLVVFGAPLFQNPEYDASMIHVQPPAFSVNSL